MAHYLMASSPYLNQYWPRYLTPSSNKLLPRPVSPRYISPFHVDMACWVKWQIFYWESWVNQGQLWGWWFYWDIINQSFEYIIKAIFTISSTCIISFFLNDIVLFSSIFILCKNNSVFKVVRLLQYETLYDKNIELTLPVSCADIYCVCNIIHSRENRVISIYPANNW